MATTPRKTSTRTKKPAATGASRTAAVAKTTAARSTAAKPTPPSKAAAVASAENAAPTPSVVTNETPDLGVPELKKKELIDAIVARSGVKKKDAKPVVESMLAVLGEELGRGREMNLKPLGKVKINRIKQMSNARVVVCKLRQNQPKENPAKDPLADAAE